MKCRILNKTKDKDFSIYYKDIRTYFKKTLKILNITTDFEITLILVDDQKIQEINKTYRQKNYPTDVITFENEDRETDFYLGDIFISLERCKVQAEKYNHSLKREFCFLFVHGLLHSLGYDHLTYQEEEEMFSLQKMILEGLKWINLKMLSMVYF